MGKRFIFLALVLAMAGCGEKKELDSNIENLGRASGPVTPGAVKEMPMEGRPQTPPNAGARHSGEILEIIDVASYTYLRFKGENGTEIWAAIPKTELEVGEQVTVIESMLMKNFTSPSLGRSFDEIIFGTLTGSGAAGAPKGDATDGGMPPGHPSVDLPVKEGKAHGEMGPEGSE